MRVEEGFDRHLNHKEYPNGHILIRSRNPLNIRPSYWGEIDLKMTERMTLYYTIENFDTEKKQYGVAIFIDREFKIRLFEAMIIYLDNDSRLISHEIIYRHLSINFIPDEFLKFIHLLVYWQLTQYFPLFYRDQPEPHVLIKMEAGFIFKIAEQVIRDFKDETSIELNTLISIMDLVLH